MVGKVIAWMVFNTVAGFMVAFFILENAYPGFTYTWLRMISGLEGL